jgi:hypothetical protein
MNTDIEEGLKRNYSQPFWRYVKSRLQNKLGVEHIIMLTSFVSDKLAKAQILPKTLLSVLIRENGDPAPEIKNHTTLTS